MGETRKLKVDCYWNLHLRCWSVRHRGKVIRHVDSLVLRDVEFVVQPAGRERCRREKRKNVHAFARGELVVCNPPGCFSMDGLSIGYNPYRHDTFVSLATEVPVLGAKRAWLRYLVDRATLLQKPALVAAEVRFVWPTVEER